MALQVAEQNYGEPQLVLIGIKENGILIARKISVYLRDIYEGKLVVIELSMNKKKQLKKLSLKMTDSCVTQRRVICL